MTKPFTCTSDGLYDRHSYRIVWKDGSHTDYKSYDVVKHMWYEYRHMAERVHVVDVTSGKGF